METKKKNGVSKETGLMLTPWGVHTQAWIKTTMQQIASDQDLNLTALLNRLCVDYIKAQRPDIASDYEQS